MNLSRRVSLPALLLLLLLGFAGPANAEIPVEPGSGSVPLGGVRRAAQACGAPGWDQPASDAQTVHAVLALRRHVAALFVSFPKQTADPDVARTLRRLAATLRWPDPELNVYRRPYGTFGAVITDNGPRTEGRTRSVLDLDLAALCRDLAGERPRRLRLCVRALGAAGDCAPAPEQRVLDHGESFLFFADPAAPALHVRYGVPRRWLLAAFASLSLWVLLPLFLAAAAAAFLKARGLLPADYLAPYQRWNSAIRCVGLLAALITIAALAPGAAPLAYLGSGGRLFSRLLWILPLPYWFLQGVLLQLAWPWLTRGGRQQRVTNPWSTVTDVAGLVAVGTVLVGPLWLSQTSGPRAVVATAPRWMGVSSILGSLPFYAFALRATLKQRPKLFHTEVPTSLPSDPPELSAVIHRLAEQIAAEPPEDRPDVERAAPLLRTLYRAIRSLEPLDQAALRVSTQLATQAARPLVRLAAAFVWVLPSSLLLPGLWLFFWPPASYQLAVALDIGLLFGELLLQRLIWRLIQVRALDREAAADQQVAAALGDRDRLLRSMRAVQDRLRQAAVPKGWVSLEKRIARLEAGK